MTSLISDYLMRQGVYHATQENTTAMLQGREPWLDEVLERIESNALSNQEYYTIAGRHIHGVPLYDLLRRRLYPVIAWSLQHVATLPGQRVLDVGCGTGLEMLFIAQYLQKNVIGLDNSPCMLQAARKRTQHLPNAQLVRGSIDELPFADASFDAAICAHTMYENIPFSYIRSGMVDYVAGCRLEEISKTLIPGGSLLWIQDYSDPMFRDELLRKFNFMCEQAGLRIQQTDDFSCDQAYTLALRCVRN